MNQIIILLPKTPKIVKRLSPSHAVFEIEGLYPGYGLTIGNALRRVLLSSLEGAAVTSIKITGVSHEFSTIPGIMEDVVELILNLKQLDFRMAGSEPQTAALKIKGEKEVKAFDIQLPDGLEVTNPDLHIATLTSKNAFLEAEMRIEKGLGYWSVESRKKEKQEVGVIPIDAVFTPIKHINYEVENMRVGERTDYNLLRLDVETDGSIKPEEALRKATEILIDHFKVILNQGEAESDKALVDRELPEKSPQKLKTGFSSEVMSEEVLKTKVEDLKLSNRTLHALIDNRIKTVAGIIRNSEEDLRNLEGLGEKSIKEIRKALGKFGLTLRQE